jgi:Cu2+-exporting ATPase
MSPGAAPGSDPDSCTLCEMPLEEPVTDPDVEGSFCCRGCLELYRRSDGEPAEDEDGDEADGAGNCGGCESAAGETAFLSVAGMHCTACERFLEGRAGALDGVTAAEASYPAGMVRLTVDPGRVDPGSVADRLSTAGYEARPASEGPPDEDDRTGRLLVGGFLGMMTMLWYVLFLYPAYLGLAPDSLLFDPAGPAGRYLLVNVWVMATVVLGYTGYPLLQGAVVSLRARRPNMDLLVATAAVTAYLYSAVALLAGRVELYFDVSVVVVLAVTAGSHYERRVRERAAGAVAALTGDRVTEARLADGGTVPVEELSGGEELLVRPGERAPVDGTVLDGEAAVDEALVTGESLPVRKEPGDTVRGGTTVTDGRLRLRTADGATSTLDRLVAQLWEAGTAAPSAGRLADRLAGVLVPVVLAVAAVATATQLVTGATPTAALLTGLAVLVVSCPCALGLATPLAIARGVGAALDRGVVVTGPAAFERAPEVDTVALDKTGTLTTGEMRLVDVVTGPDAERTGAPGRADGGTVLGDRSGRGSAERELLRRAAAVEAPADHPVAAAVREAAPAVPGVERFEGHPGRGVSGRVDGERVVAGHRDLFDGWVVPGELAERYERAESGGRLPVLVGWDGRARGVLVAEDRPRPGWEAAVDALAERADRVALITGDGEAAAGRFAAHPAVDETYTEVRPSAKTELLERAEGTTVMVGDGSNDAPALAAADVGIAVSGGTALAAEAADAVVPAGEPEAAAATLEVAAATRRRLRENLAWAFCYNAVAVPLAATGLLNPLFAAVAMAASSLLVVGNSARSL